MKRYFRLKRCAKFYKLIKEVIINGKAVLFPIGNKELSWLTKKTSIYFDSKHRYRSPRMTAELASLGNNLSRVTVAKYMNQLGLRSKLSKKFKVTTNSKHKHVIVQNILNREFSVTESSKVWFHTLHIFE